MMGSTLVEREGERWIRCEDPRDGRHTAELRCTAPSELPRLARKAREAQAPWWESGLPARKAAVARLHEAFLDRAADVARVLEEECGRPAGEAWTSEVVANHHLFRYWLGSIGDLLVSTPLQLSPIDYPRKRGVVRLEPRGLIGLITPWNLPVAIPLRALLPALLSGNAVLWKASEHSPRSAALLAELCREALPPGVLQLVQGDRHQGEALVRAGIDALFFTGSVATGRHLSRLAGELMIPASLELGGKDAAVVLADADLERAARGIVWAAFAFAGQNCAAVERCYVHSSLYPAFVERVVALTQALRPLQDIGPLTTRAQLELVQRQVAEAVAAGAKLRCGGQAPGPGLYHEPTVLTDLPPGIALLEEETFGPVLPIEPFSEVNEVVERVNRSRFGLTTSLWTRDTELGEAMAASFDCGVVTINNHAFTGALPDGTWGGVKDSGRGVTNSRFALYEMVRPRTVVVDELSGPEMWWQPYNGALVDVARGLIEMSRPKGAWLQGVRGALTGFANRWKNPS